MLLGCTPLLACAQKSPDARSIAALKAGFESPPPQARLRCYWWWLNGHTDKATITHDLEEMAAKGISGALLVDADGASQEGNAPVPNGPTFGSPAWIDLYTHALREADRLGIEITLNITSGWNLGGPDVTPEQASKLLTWTRTQVHGGAPVSVRLPQPPMQNGFYRQIAVLAYPLHQGTRLTPLPGLRERSAAVETGFSMPESNWMLTPNGHPHRGGGLNKPTTNDLEQHARQAIPSATPAPQSDDAALSEVRDVSQSVSTDGQLTWNAPPGEWEVLRIGYTDSDARVSTSSGAWQGLAIDYLSRDAFNTYWDHTVEPLLQAAKPFHSLKYLATDSWELGGTNWTDTFASEFSSRRGYDPLPWLPVVAGRIINSPDASARFLTDLRRTVGDLITENHYCVFQQRAAAHGLGMQAESGGPHGAPLDALDTFRCSPMPQTEFWAVNRHRLNDSQRFFVKEAASAANIYGQPLALAEGETSVGPQWSESPASDLKQTFDMAVTEGLNRLVWHEFTSSPASEGLPGQEYFAGTHLNPNVTWWPQSAAFFAYLNRVQFMMQQGKPVDDLLYFYGDNVPAFARLKASDPARVLPGFDYDVTGEDALLNHLRITKDGMLESASGVRWRALMLPVERRLSLQALDFVQRFLNAGGTVIGLPPTSPSGLVSSGTQAKWQQVENDIWGSSCPEGTQKRYGAGHLFCTASARQALLDTNLQPDVDVSPGLAAGTVAHSDASFDYIHRRSGDRDIYFLRNGSPHASTRDVVFRVQNRNVELWDAVTGEIMQAHATQLGDGLTRLNMTLPPYGSIFVVFAPDRSAGALPQGNIRQVLPLAATRWQIGFQPGRGAPTKPVITTELKSWTEWPQPGVRYFSGTGTYHATIPAPAFHPGEQVLLRFTDIREIAHVRINGKDAGTVWAHPFEIRVDPWLHPGSNHLDIDVTNLWPNRIIGDLQPGVEQRITHTNIRSYHRNSPLLPSGLIGPVSWVIVDSGTSSAKE